MEFTLLVAAAAGVLALAVELRWEASGRSAADGGADLWEIAVTAAVTGLVTGRLAAMIADGVNPLAHPADILIVRGGVATGPAGLGALAAVAWAGRRRPWIVADGLSAAALAGLAGWHAGCLARGDACLGTGSDLLWAITRTGSTVSRHPVELYAAILLAVAAVVIARWKRVGRPRPGVPAALALAVAGAVRLGTEPMRPALSHSPARWYALAVAAGAAATWWRLRATRAPDP